MEKSPLHHPSSPFVVERLKRHLPWFLVLLTIVLLFSIRVRLRDMPLERDEGEYAYAGQLMLHGIPPYKDAYNMKLPGTYVGYALIMSAFGRSPAGIHLGLALVNAASIVLVFLLGRRLLDPAAGAAAAVAFAFMSLSPSVLGLAAHATHFVILFALGGILLLLKAEDLKGQVRRQKGEGFSSPFSLFPAPFFLAGLLFGLAFLMKQHGLFFGLFGIIYMVWESRTWKGERRRERRIEGSSFSLLASRFSLFPAGLILPYVLTCIVLWLAGVAGPFFFWTVSYAGKYAAAIPLGKGGEMLRAALQTGGGPGLLFWLLPALAAVMMWWEQRLTVSNRFFLTALTLCSFLAMSIGLYFRSHYFILLLPALALLIGVAISRALFLLRHDRTIELFLAIPILGLFPIALGATLLEDGRLYFDISPALASRYIYHSTLFSETAKAADYIAAQMKKEAGQPSMPDAPRSLAVLGSEPEIYFYSGCHAATGFIYTYPLMEEHAYALKLQEQMIQEIERARPEYVVFVDENTSWLPWPNAERRIFEWWKAYWANNLDLVKTIPIEGAGERSGVFTQTGQANDPDSGREQAKKYIFIFKRKQQ